MNRRMIYLGVLLCKAGVLFSCSSKPLPEAAPETEPKAVGFAVEETKSRAIITSGADEILSLGIFGYSTGTADFDPEDETVQPNLLADCRAARTREEVGETVVLSDWEYTPPAYWPLDPAVKNTFFAYSPHVSDIESGVVEEVADGDTEGCPYLIYTVEEDASVSDQVDLLYAECHTVDDAGNSVSWNTNVSNINYATNNGKVKFTMKHAMAWVRFLILPMEELDEEGEREEDGLYAITEFYFSAGDFITSARLDLCTGRWTPEASGPVTYTFDHLDVEESTWQNMWVKDGPVYLGTTENCLMLIPQDVVLTDNETAVFVSYWYDGDGVAPYDYTEYYRTMPFPDVKLRAGSVMTYIVKISVTGASLEFHSENTIEAWLNDPSLREVEVF